MALSSCGRPLVIAGAILFLAGLLQGAVIAEFANPRMALSAHLTAVQSGMAMMIAGIIWGSVSLPPIIKTIARWTIVVGMYGLWAGLTLSAATGASEVLPMAGAGYAAGPAMELIVRIIVLGSSISMTLGWLLLVLGLIRSPPHQ